MAYSFIKTAYWLQIHKGTRECFVLVSFMYLLKTHFQDIKICHQQCVTYQLCVQILEFMLPICKEKCMYACSDIFEPAVDKCILHLQVFGHGMLT